MISNVPASSAPISSRMEALLPARNTNADDNASKPTKNKSEKAPSPKAKETSKERSKSPELSKSPTEKLNKDPLPKTNTSRSKSPMRMINKDPVPKMNTSRSKSPTRVKNKDPLPKTNVKGVRRQQRRSFQGIGVIESKDRKAETGSVDTNKLEQMKIDRRKKSMDIMRKSAQSDQIRQMMENTVEEFVTTREKSVEERLQAVMTKAKERGMTADSIFSFFNGGNPNTTQITKESFLASIIKLEDSLIFITAEELTNIVDKFDKNGDGEISIAEFKNYCYYEIPSVAWKAERTRLEKSGEMKMLKAQLSRRFRKVDFSDENDCGDEVHRTSKFFWKANNNVEIRVFFTEFLNVITLQIYSQTLEKELPSIYVCKNKVTHQHSSHKEEVRKALQKLENLPAESAAAESAERDASWESISKYVVARLKLWERIDSEDTNAEVPTAECVHIPKEATFVPYLGKLTGDTYTTLMIPKPLNLHPPPAIVCGTTISNNFDKKMESFCNASRKARSSRRSAQGMANLVSSVLTDVQATLMEEVEPSNIN